MIELGESTSNEMVLAFLRAELDSPRFGPMYLDLLAQSGRSRRDVIDRADLGDGGQNQIRSFLLRGVRGYTADEYLFRGFPSNARWRSVQLDPSEVAEMLYAKFPTWEQLSGGSRRVGDGARNIHAVSVGENANEHILDIAEAVRQGQRYPELIAVQRQDGSFVLLEGHARATAYVVAGHKEPIKALVADSPSMNEWAFL